MIIQKNEKRCSISIVYAFLSSSVILKLFYRNEYNPHHWEIHQTFNLVPIVMLCLAVSTTVYSGKSKLRNDYGKWCEAIGGIFAVLWPLLNNYEEHNLKKDSFPEDVMDLILNPLPLGSSYFVHGSEELGILAYANLVEGKRSDVKLYSQNGVLFGNRLFYAGSSKEKTQNHLSQFLESGDAIYAMELRPEFKASLDPNWSLVETGGFRMFKSVGVLKKVPNINIDAVKMLLDR